MEGRGRAEGAMRRRHWLDTEGGFVIRQPVPSLKTDGSLDSNEMAF